MTGPAQDSAQLTALQARLARVEEEVASRAPLEAPPRRSRRGLIVLAWIVQLAILAALGLSGLGQLVTGPDEAPLVAVVDPAEETDERAGGSESVAAEPSAVDEAPVVDSEGPATGEPPSPEPTVEPAPPEPTVEPDEQPVPEPDVQPVPEPDTDAERAAAATRSALEISGKAIYFETRSASVSSRSGAALDRIASLLKSHPELARIRIAGHTDLVGPAGPNRVLSKRRAEAVKRELVRRGVASGRLETIGYGEDRPLVAGQSEEANRENRRVEFITSE